MQLKTIPYNPVLCLVNLGYAVICRDEPNHPKLLEPLEVFAVRGYRLIRAYNAMAETWNENMWYRDNDEITGTRLEQTFGLLQTTSKILEVVSQFAGRLVSGLPGPLPQEFSVPEVRTEIVPSFNEMLLGARLFMAYARDDLVHLPYTEPAHVYMPLTYARVAS